MLNLAEYRTRTDRLADHLPWAALVAPGVILNKDGSFQRSFAFRGPDLESATEAELVSVCARANNALKRLGTGWALFFEADRRPAPGYPDGRFPDAASWLVDAERRAGFEAEGQHFESHFTGTLVWLPPADGQDAAGRALVERPDGEKGRDWRAALSGFTAETDRLLDLLSGFMPEVRALSDSETLTFLHRTISDRPHPVSVPDTPVYLDALLPDSILTGGLEPRLGELHLRTLTLLGFPNVSRPGLLDALNHQAFGYRWVTRFIALDKSDATKALNARQIELIARATPKKQYYLQSARGNRLFELGLGPIALALCGASGAADQARIDDVLDRHDGADFAASYLSAAGLAWAASLLSEFPDQLLKE